MSGALFSKRRKFARDCRATAWIAERLTSTPRPACQKLRTAIPHPPARSSGHWQIDQLTRSRKFLSVLFA